MVDPPVDTSCSWFYLFVVGSTTGWSVSREPWEWKGIPQKHMLRIGQKTATNQQQKWQLFALKCNDLPETNSKSPWKSLVGVDEISSWNGLFSYFLLLVLGTVHWRIFFVCLLCIRRRFFNGHRLEFGILTGGNNKFCFQLLCSAGSCDVSETSAFFGGKRALKKSARILRSFWVSEDRLLTDETKKYK